MVNSFFSCCRSSILKSFLPLFPAPTLLSFYNVDTRSRFSSLRMILSLLHMEMPPLLSQGLCCPLFNIIAHNHVSLFFRPLQKIQFNWMQPLALLSKMYQSIKRLLCFSVRKGVQAAHLGESSWELEKYSLYQPEEPANATDRLQKVTKWK